MNDLNTFAVLGFGTMGAGIAHALASSGRDVIVLEESEERLASGFAFINEFLDQGVARGKVSSEEKQRLLDRISGTTTCSGLRDADAVLEAVTEDLAVKTALLSEVAGVVGDNVPLLTNTSALSVTELAAGLPNPQRVAGLHFFNPAPLMGTVEVVRAVRTEPALIEVLSALVESLGKSAVIVEDRPGFLINALLIPFLNDVMQEYDDGLASAEDIDTALRLGLGYKSGPLELLDLIGLDVHLRATQCAFAETGDVRYVPPPLLRRMVAAGALGAKSGEGFRLGGSTNDDKSDRGATQ